MSGGNAHGRLRVVFVGLTITSSWGNGHATTYRALLRALRRRGHEATFLEQDVPYYAAHRDLPAEDCGFAGVHLYPDVEALQERHEAEVRDADLVVLGSYVPQGARVAAWALALRAPLGRPTAFYDIDTPVTLAGLRRGDCAYLQADQVPRFDAYLSFTAGPVLARLERELGARRAWPLLCSVDPAEHRPDAAAAEAPRWDLGYLGTYSPDRQAALERLLVEPARRLPRARFAVAGPRYPPSVAWPGNVDRVDHLPPAEHRGFYTRQRFTLNVTRADMVASGHAPSVRIFEAAACGVPLVSDAWPGLDALLEPGREVLVAHGPEDVARILTGLPEEDRRALAARARERVLREHSGDARAAQFLGYAEALLDGGRGRLGAVEREVRHAPS